MKLETEATLTHGEYLAAASGFPTCPALVKLRQVLQPMISKAWEVTELLLGNLRQDSSSPGMCLCSLQRIPSHSALSKHFVESADQITTLN